MHTEPQYSASIAIAQAAPAPNDLFVALKGSNVGLNAGGLPTALLGMTVAMVGIMIHSTTLTYLDATRGHAVAFTQAANGVPVALPLLSSRTMSSPWYS